MIDVCGDPKDDCSCTLGSFERRAIVAENKLEQAREALRAFYDGSDSAAAIKALRRLCNTLDVVIERQPGVPETLVREFNYYDRRRGT